MPAIPSYDDLIRVVASVSPAGLPGERVERLLSALLSSASVYVSPRLYSRFAAGLLLYPLAAEVLAVLLSPALLPVALPFLVAMQLLPLLAPCLLRLSRRKFCEAELPFFLMGLTVFSHESYPTLQEGFSRVAASGASVFRGFCREAALLERDLTFSPGPAPEVMERTFSHHPSHRLREFIHSFQSSLDAGRGAVEFVEEETSRQVSLLEESWKGFSSSLASIAELCFILLALFPVGLQMIAATLPGADSTSLLILSFVLLSALSAVLLLMVDASQPALHNRQSGALPSVLSVSSWLVCTALFYANLIPLSLSVLIPLAVSSALAARTFAEYSRVRRGEDEVSSFIHDLAEVSRVGVSLPEALFRQVSRLEDYRSIRDSVLTFYHSIRMGDTPAKAQAKVSHPSWLVRSSFAILALAFATGAGFEQLERLSSFFRRITDARRAASRSLIPFFAMGVAVPVISASSLSFLNSMGPVGSMLVPGFSAQVSHKFVVLSISLASMLTGVLLSKLLTLSVRNLVALPVLLLSTLVSFLFFFGLG